MKIPLKQYWQLFVKYLQPHRLAAIGLTLLLLSTIALQLINPQIIRYFIDAAQNAAPTQTLVKSALLFLLLAAVQQVLSVVSMYLSENIAWKTTNALRNDLAEHCLNLDLPFHNAHPPGEMIERLDGDVTTLANFFSQFLINFAGNLVLMVGILALLFQVDWRVGLAVGSFACIALFILFRFRDIAVPHWTAERQASADLYSFLEERLAGTEDIRSNGAEAYVMRRFYHLTRILTGKSIKAAMMVNILLNTLFFLFAAGTATAFAIGAHLFQMNAISIGTVYIIFYYTTMLETPIDIITHQIGDLQKAGSGISRIQELLQTQRKILECSPNNHVPFKETKLGVSFRDITFGYDDASQKSQESGLKPEFPTRDNGKEIILDHLSFHLQPGTVLGLLGRTGSGKTTLTRLLFRFYDPDSGCIQLGPDHHPENLVDIRQFPLGTLRQTIGMVTQNIQLFNASVRDNLTFFDPSVSDEKLMAVIAELGLSQWLHSLPDGLNSLLESGGSGLSGGEAQLLAFVRIFLKNPGLVILDEASSRLDPATEMLLERAIDRLVTGRTAIIIAHRLETVQRVDEIMILEAGKVIEFGPRQQLADDPASHFYHLLQTGIEEVLA